MHDSMSISVYMYIYTHGTPFGNLPFYTFEIDREEAFLWAWARWSPNWAQPSGFKINLVEIEFNPGGLKSILWGVELNPPWSQEPRLPRDFTGNLDSWFQAGLNSILPV